MTERTKNLRNIAIVFALAAIVYAVPGGGLASAGISNVLSIILFAGLAFFAYRLYMEHRITLLDLPDDQRFLLYGSVTLAIVTLLATGRLWDGSGPGILVWFALIGLVAFGFSTLVRKRNEY